MRFGTKRRRFLAELTEIIFIIFKKNDLKDLSIMKQGRNSDGSPRNVKYLLDLEYIDNFENYIIKI